MKRQKKKREIIQELVNTHPNNSKIFRKRFSSNLNFIFYARNHHSIPIVNDNYPKKKKKRYTMYKMQW